jgi:hypothetical protein
MNNEQRRCEHCLSVLHDQDYCGGVGCITKEYSRQKTTQLSVSISVRICGIDPRFTKKSKKQMF